MKPLEGLLVIDFSQFLSGPSASLRLADMGARVIKIERPGVGDLCRQLYISNLMLDGDSTLFHSINRNKQSYAADLKNPDDLARIRKLLAQTHHSQRIKRVNDGQTHAHPIGTAPATPRRSERWLELVHLLVGDGWELLKLNGAPSLYRWSSSDAWLCPR